MPLPSYTALVSLLAVALYAFIATRVAVAHRRYGVKLPAMGGNADFERTYRAHVNMLEWMPSFMVPLWLCAAFLNDIVAAALGMVWVTGRAIYFIGYSEAVEKRLPGFLIQALACVLLFVAALIGVVRHMMAG